MQFVLLPSSLLLTSLLCWILLIAPPIRMSSSIRTLKKQNLFLRVLTHQERQILVFVALFLTLPYLWHHVLPLERRKLKSLRSRLLLQTKRWRYSCHRIRFRLNDWHPRQKPKTKLESVWLWLSKPKTELLKSNWWFKSSWPIRNQLLRSLFCSKV